MIQESSFQMEYGCWWWGVLRQNLEACGIEVSPRFSGVSVPVATVLKEFMRKQAFQEVCC